MILHKVRQRGYMPRSLWTELASDAAPDLPSATHILMPRKREHYFWRATAECVAGMVALALITFVCFHSRLTVPTPTFLYLIVIVLLSLRGSFLSSAVVSFAAVGCLDYFFVRPLFSFEVGDPIDIVAIIAFLTTSAVITRLVSRVRNLMQEKLERSETYLAEAQQLSHTGSFGWKVATGEIVWSAETFRIFQLDQKSKPTLELIFQRIHPDDAALVKRAVEIAAQESKDFQFEHRLLLPDGSVKYIDVVAHAETDNAGQLEFVGAVMDVTERKRAEDSLHDAQANLARIARLTTMGELTAAIAHEVNQPLAAVVTNANACLRWLDRASPDLDEARDAIRRIIRDGNRGSEVIARIRAILNKEPKPKEKLDINDVVRETIALTRVYLQGASLQTELSPALPVVLADRVQLQQVLLNLMVNAIDAMKTVTDRPRILRLETKTIEGGDILVVVQDSGIGLDQKQMDQLFEVFYTTKPQGMGMGLAISRSIIDGHGGRLWAEANDGPGATFKFTLPIAEGDAA
jgi:signal transduction histidine kinase